MDANGPTPLNAEPRLAERSVQHLCGHHGRLARAIFATAPIGPPEKNLGMVEDVEEVEGYEF